MTSMDMVYSALPLDVDLTPSWIQCTYLDAEMNPMSGTVTFTPAPKFVTNVVLNTIIASTPVPAVLDDTGSINVEVMATDDAAMNPYNWTYTVNEDLVDAAGNTYSNSYAIQAPGNTVVNLAEVAPVADSTGVPIVRGRTGPSLYYQIFSYTGSLATKTGNNRFYFDDATLIVSTRASVGTAPGGQAVIVDVKINGTSIFNVTPANRPTIAAGTTTDLGGTPDRQTLNPGDYLTVDIVQIGTTPPGSDLTVQVGLSRL